MLVNNYLISIIILYDNYKSYVKTYVKALFTHVLNG
jgi:hypothetical protein